MPGLFRMGLTNHWMDELLLYLHAVKVYFLWPFNGSKFKLFTNWGRWWFVFQTCVPMTSQVQRPEVWVTGELLIR